MTAIGCASDGTRAMQPPRAGGRPAGAANSQPRPRFLGLGLGKGKAAAKVDRAENGLGRKMSDGPNFNWYFLRKLRHINWAAY